jgi:hypothetical protein
LKFLPIRNTRSPSGRFEFVCGLRGVNQPTLHQVIWAKNESDIFNSILDRRSGKLVGTLPRYDTAYKSGGNDFPGRSHSKLVVTWNPTEETLVVVHEGKWRYNAIYFGERVRGQFRFQEIGGAIDNFVRAEARNRHPREYAKWHRADDSDPYVRIPEGKIDLKPGRLSVPVECNVVTLAIREKTTFGFSGRVELRVTNSHGQLRIAPNRFVRTR